MAREYRDLIALQPFVQRLESRRGIKYRRKFGKVEPGAVKRLVDVDLDRTREKGPIKWRVERDQWRPTNKVQKRKNCIARIRACELRLSAADGDSLVIKDSALTQGTAGLIKINKIWIFTAVSIINAEYPFNFVLVFFVSFG